MIKGEREREWTLEVGWLFCWPLWQLGVHDQCPLATQPARRAVLISKSHGKAPGKEHAFWVTARSERPYAYIDHSRCFFNSSTWKRIPLNTVTELPLFWVGFVDSRRMGPRRLTLQRLIQGQPFMPCYATLMFALPSRDSQVGRSQSLPGPKILYLLFKGGIYIYIYIYQLNHVEYYVDG